MSTLAPLRWATLHPLLVHVTLGVVPVVLVAYALAATRRSERWSFAGDVALWIGAASALATVASGLLANALVPWPGGLEPWRWLHLGLGIAAALLLGALALARLRSARRGIAAGPRALLAAVGVAAVLGATGWVGGEVLVFHSGMAVAAAAHGSLAPAAELGASGPTDLEDAMGDLRGAWAEATTQLDLMIVQRPTEEGYARIATAAGRLAELSAWLEASGPAAIARERGERGAPDPGALAEMASRLRGQAQELERSARARQLPGVARGLGAITTSCAGCHLAVRWAE